MKNVCLTLSAFTKLGFLFAVAFLLTSPAAAQYDLQIMVNGPWDYVADPSDDRIILVGVSPKTAPHEAYIFPGPDARPHDAPHPMSDFQLFTNTDTDAAIYSLNFTPVGDGNLTTDDEPASAYKPTQTISALRISHVLGTSLLSAVPRYAISLPVPDEITTYAGEYGSGFSESKIIVGSITPGTPPKNYTEWMVLHYSVTQIPNSIQVKRRGMQPQSMLTNSDQGKGISIVLMQPMGSANDANSLKCDDASGVSFSASMKLWGLHEHTRFPVQDMQGQKPGYYDYKNCDEFHKLNLSKAEVRLKNIRIAAVALDDLRSDLLSLAAKMAPKPTTLPTSEMNWLNDAQNNLQTIRKYKDQMWPGGYPTNVGCALDCTQEFIFCKKSPKNPECKDAPRCKTSSSKCQSFNLDLDKDIEALYGKVDKHGDGGVTQMTVGRSDCHKAQFSINGVLP